MMTSKQGTGVFRFPGDTQGNRNSVNLQECLQCQMAGSLGVEGVLRL
jgi:hypothetical protein